MATRALRPVPGVRSLVASRTVVSGVSFASSGLSFAVANVIFANQLSVSDYGAFALLVAVIMLSASVGMLGADGIVNRHAVAPEPKVFGRVALTSCLVALAIAFAVTRIYDLPPRLAALLVPAIVAFSLTRFCGAYLQSRMRLASSLLFSNSLNYLLLGVAIASIFAGYDDIFLLLFLVMTLQCVVAGISIRTIRAQYRRVVSDYRYDWRESLAYIFMASSSEALVQLDRLVTPRVLDLDSLAVLGILLAIVGPPFRLLHLALGYDLLPVLRQSKDHSERISLIVRQSLVALALIVPLWIVIWFAAPLIQRTFLPGEYAMPGSLILAALVAGTIKAFSGIAQAGVTALASVRSMEIAGVIGWASVLVGVVAAAYGARYGLTGVVYGVGAGWAIRLLAASFILSRELDEANPLADETMRLKILADESNPDV